jgi:hypothetical protein
VKSSRESIDLQPSSTLITNHSSRSESISINPIHEIILSLSIPMIKYSDPHELRSMSCDNITPCVEDVRFKDYHHNKQIMMKCQRCSNIHDFLSITRNKYLQDSHLIDDDIYYTDIAATHGLLLDERFGKYLCGFVMIRGNNYNDYIIHSSNLHAF